MKLLLLAMCLAGISRYTIGANRLVEGSYASKDVSLEVIIMDQHKGVVAATTSVTQGACSGEVAGIGQISGNRITLFPYVKFPGGEACELTVDFDSNFMEGKIIENEKCFQYHGSACAWEGQVIKKNMLNRRGNCRR